MPLRSFTLEKSVDMASVTYCLLQNESISPLVWQGREGLIDEAQQFEGKREWEKVTQQWRPQRQAYISTGVCGTFLSLWIRVYEAVP